MATNMNDISGYLQTNAVASANKRPVVQQKNDNMGLNMQDFLTLMVTELQSQSIDSTADTSEMLNQMVMMQMVSALTNMTDASVMGYAASLVGKTVTVGQVDGNGELQEIVGTVTGTGSMNGSQVVFVNDKYYYMNEIMAVGTLPKAEKPDTDPEKPEEPAEKPAEPSENETPQPAAASIVPKVTVPQAPTVEVPDIPEVILP